jgi:hypothetical protein
VRRARGWLHLLLGRAYLVLQRKDRARKQFQEVLSCSGDDFQAHVQLGRIALLEGNLAAAVRDLGAARRCDPTRFAKLQPELSTVVSEAYSDDACDTAVRPGVAGHREIWGGPNSDGPAWAGEIWNGDAHQQPSFHLDPPGQDSNGLLPGNGWGWYLDPADQGSGPGLTPAKGWSSGWPNGAFEPPDRPEQVNEEAGPGWWSEAGPNDLDDLTGDLAEFESAALEDEELSWADPPLAAFYWELSANDVIGRPDDFTSEDEEIRFRNLPPIRRTDFEDVDWEDLAARLRELG